MVRGVPALQLGLHPEDVWQGEAVKPWVPPCGRRALVTVIWGEKKECRCVDNVVYRQSFFMFFLYERERETEREMCVCVCV